MKKSQPLQEINQTPADDAGERKDFLLSLVIPCYNESARIELMLAGLADFEEKWKGNYEVIVVDDGSKDDTAAKVQQAISSGAYTQLKDKVRIEKMPANKGKGAALKKGVSLANGDYILTLDADMSTRPAELINWQRREKGLFSGSNTIYIGSRKHEEGKVEALQSRRIIGGVFNGIVQILTSLQLKDTQCGFKLYPRQAATLLFGNMQSKGWAHDVELLYQADLNDINIVEMPISWVNQPESKVNVFKDSLLMLFGVMSIALRIWFYNTFMLPFRVPAAATAAQRKNIMYRSVFNVVALLLVIVMPAMSFQYAITGDEHWHYDYGNSIYNYFFHGDTSAQTATTGIQYYGGIFDFITASFYNTFHLWDHYTTMHFFNALVGAIGIIYAGKLAKLLGGWQAGLLAMVFLVLSPSWFGHNFANPKDIPFSVGYTAGIYFILSFLKALPQPNARHVFGLVCSIGWAMGVRIGGFLLIAYLIMFIGIYALLHGQLKAVFKRRIIVQVCVVGLLGYLIALICWPYAHLGIVSKPLEALKVMSNFFVNIGLLYDGKKIMSNQVPWFYIPRYILYTAPVVVLAGFALSFISIPAFLGRRKNVLLFAALVLFTCVFPLAYAIYKKSSLYDGWRHFLFIYPPLVVLASLGFTAIAGKQKVLGYVVGAVIVLGLVAPARFAVQWHPFESLYYNEIAGGLKNMYGKYETDYYMLGVKPATEWLVANEHVATRDVVVATNCINPLLAYFDDMATYKSYTVKKRGDTIKLNHCFLVFRGMGDGSDKAMGQPAMAANLSLCNEGGVLQEVSPVLVTGKKKYIEDGIASTGFSVRLASFTASGTDTTAEILVKQPVPAVYVSFYSRYSKDWDYCILFSRFVDVSQLTTTNWPPAETIHTIDVDGVPIAAILKRKTKKDFAGFELMKAKKTDEAKAMFLASLQEYPGNELVWETLAEIYDAEGNTDSALYAANKTLQKYPGDVTMYQIMGGVYLKAHKPDSAMALYKNLEKYNEGESHFLQAYAYATMGNVNSAYAEIDNAIEADPYNQQAYKLAIQIARQTKDGIREEEYTEKVTKAFPEAAEK